jgi:HSP20 family protein
MYNTPVNVNQTYGSSLLPSKMWDTLRSEVEGLFNRFSASFEAPEFRQPEVFWPRQMGGFASLDVDVHKTEKAYFITAEIPGVDEKKLEVDVSDDALVIKGEKMQEPYKETKFYVSERCYGAFQRTFPLPKDVDRSNISAKYAHGVLTVFAPRIAVAQNGHKIHVKAA